MNTDALDKLRDQITIARESGTFVVLTPDEAQAIIDQISGPAVLTVSKESAAEIARAFLDGAPGRIEVWQQRETWQPIRKPEAWIAYPASGKALTFYPERAARWRELGDHVVALYPGPDEAKPVGGCPVCGDDACPGNHAAGSVVAGGPPYENEDEHV